MSPIGQKNPPDQQVAPQAQPRSQLSLIVATVITVVYILLSGYLLYRFGLDNPVTETSWQRALIIYNGIASVGFAAIGVLLGTSVQQVNLSAARKEASDAKQDADKKTDAIKNALTKLNAPASGKPGDLGSGPKTEESRTVEAHDILLRALR